MPPIIFFARSVDILKGFYDEHESMLLWHCLNAVPTSALNSVAAEKTKSWESSLSLANNLPPVSHGRILKRLLAVCGLGST
jgi:hypothetical protein